MICESIQFCVSSKPNPNGTEPKPQKRLGYSFTVVVISEIFFSNRFMLSSFLFAPASILYNAFISVSSSFRLPAFSGCGAEQNKIALSTPAASILSSCIFVGNMMCS